MALLAIYRNLKDEWSDERRAPYQEYYAEWTPNYIDQFSLTEVSLPVMLCTFPSLDTDYEGDYDVKKAARSIFLTLNKTARKVSESRNILLNDNDIISFFLRNTLSKVKKKDSRSPFSFRIWNVELDQFEDRLRIQSPIAVTGVNHIYYMIEHTMLDSEDVQGISPRSGRFGTRKDLDNCLERLDGRNLLGSDVANTIQRYNFSMDAAERLGQQFDEWYGRYIISAYEKFALFESHNRAALDLASQLEVDRDRKLRPILFEGQGIGRVFESHRANLREKLREGTFKTDVPAIEAQADRLDATAQRLTEHVNDFCTQRALLCLAEISSKSELNAEDGNLDLKVIDWFNKLFDNVLFTVAFQTAMICGFFGEVEKARKHSDSNDFGLLAIQASFDEYIDQLNTFFIPKTIAQFKRLIRIFTGEINENATNKWQKFTPSNQTFRSVVYQAEMQPVAQAG